jgi:ABC-type sugar transport system ATPase subunit
MPDLIIKELSKSYGKNKVLKNVSFILPQGSVLCLDGPSGGGKTTLLQIISGLMLPNSGEVLLGEELLSNKYKAKAPYKRGMAIAFQVPALFAHMSVLQNIIFAAGKQNTARAKQVCQALEINDILNSSPLNISGGQAKRAELARALATNASILLLDEPTAHLDAKLRENVIRTVLELCSKEGTSVLYVTHSAEEIKLLGANVLSLINGVLNA